jgi:hypothetical protein
MLIAANQYSRALDMCIQHEVFITEVSLRTQAIPRFGCMCQIQGYHLAPKHHFLKGFRASCVRHTLTRLLTPNFVSCSSQEMAEAMTPSKDVVSAEERNLALQRIAKIAKKQGSWQLAAKKYTQVDTIQEVLYFSTTELFVESFIEYNRGVWEGEFYEGVVCEVRVGGHLECLSGHAL